MTTDDATDLQNDWPPEVVIPNEPPDFITREGRPYVHKHCGQVTVVAGRHFPQVCNPFRMVTGTICATCGFPASTKDVAWTDTGETVSSYRRRRVKTHPIAMLFAWLLIPLAGAAAGVMIGEAIRKPNAGADPFVVSLIFGGLGFLFTALFIGPALVEAVTGRRLFNEW